MTKSRSWATKVRAFAEPGVIWATANAELCDGSAYFAAEVRTPGTNRVEVDLLRGSLTEPNFLYTQAICPISVRVPVAPLEPGTYDVVVRSYGFQQEFSIAVPTHTVQSRAVEPQPMTPEWRTRNRVWKPGADRARTIYGSWNDAMSADGAVPLRSEE